MMLRTNSVSLSCRFWSTSLIFKRNASVDYLLSSIKLIDGLKSDTQASPKKTTTHPKFMRTKIPPKDATLLAITPGQLTDYFRYAEYLKPANKQLSETQALFNRSKVRLEWTLDNYNEIPYIKYKRLLEEKTEKLANMEPYRKTEYHETQMNSKKTFGFQPNLLRSLPEVLLLGHTNVGKSSLINTLLVNREENKSANSTTEHAYVSKRAGYTRTLNCFNIGNKLRLMDSPGYGEFGESSQGEVVTDYISKSQALRRVFVLVDSLQGFQDEDLQIINFLINEGVSFDIIFTKVDQVIQNCMPKSVLNSNSKKGKKEQTMEDRIKNAALITECNQKVIGYFKTMIKDSNMADLVTLPKLIFNNAQTNKFVPTRYGYKEIRLEILQCCGLVGENNNMLLPREEITKEQNKIRKKAKVSKL